jgi:hypothetical protein
MAYAEAELKANSDEESLCFRPNTIGHTSDKQLPIRSSIQDSFDHNYTNHTSFIGIPI